jgi:hypothetical protein
LQVTPARGASALHAHRRFAAARLSRHAQRFCSPRDARGGIVPVTRHRNNRTGRERAMPKRIAACGVLALALLALALALLVPGRTARAQTWLGAPGTAGTQEVGIGASKLTLPPGTWELVTGRGQGSNNANAINWRSEVYLQVLDGKVGAVVAFGANESAASGHRARWLVPNQCGIKASTYVVTDDRNVDNAYGSFDCMLVTFYRYKGGTAEPLLAPLAERAAALGGMPKAMLFAAFAQTSRSRQDSVQVEVFVNPGTPSFLAALRAAGIAAPKVAPADMLKVMTAWAAAYRPTVAASMP